MEIDGAVRYFGGTGFVRGGNAGRVPRAVEPAKGRRMETQIKVIVEKHPDGYVAYPLGVKGVVVGEGDSYQAALDDVRSAIAFHVETFGPDSLLDGDSPVVEAFVAEANMAG